MIKLNGSRYFSKHFSFNLPITTFTFTQAIISVYRTDVWLQYKTTAWLHSYIYIQSGYFSTLQFIYAPTKRIDIISTYKYTAQVIQFQAMTLTFLIIYASAKL